MGFKGMTSRRSAAAWDEGFPAGNGKMGALVMGDPFHEVVILNHEELFLPLPCNHSSPLPGMWEELPHIRRLLREGNSRKASELFYERSSAKGFPRELVWTDPFHPAFDLKVLLEECGAHKNYLRSLDFETGEVRIVWSDDRGDFLRRLFVSKADDVFVLSITAPSQEKLACTLKLEERPRKELTHKSQSTAQQGWLYFHSCYAVGHGGYDGIVRVTVHGGSQDINGNEIQVRDAEEMLVLGSIVPYESEEQRDLHQVKSRLEKLEESYDSLLEAHVHIHREMFRRVTLDLEKAGQELLTNEELLKKAGNGEVRQALIEKLHDFGRYLLISSSGKLPPNLQGVWNGIWNPPWSSDYTLDENLQMMMWPVLPGNLPEAACSFFNLIEGFIEDWRENARKFYGCRGVLSSARASRNGLHKHFSVQYPLQFWTAGAGWLAQTFYDYWLFTDDREFLAKRAVPFMKEVALFYQDFLVTDDAGRLEFNPSYSPENTPAGKDNAACINATMDIAVAKELLTNLVAACQELDMEEEQLPIWRRLLEKLPPYMVNDDGALQEWAYPGMKDNYHHRHSSHLYPVFPGFEVTKEETPHLYEACLRAAEMRMVDGLEAITGWGLAHLANCSARLKDSQLAFKALCRIAGLFVLPNLFATHNIKELFQMDANLGFTAAIMEMLVFSKPGWIELLPALPQELNKGSIRGLLCRGQITLETLEWDMGTSEVGAVLRGTKDCTLTVKLPKEIRAVELNHGTTEHCPGQGSTFAVRLMAGVSTGLRFLLHESTIGN